jgi:dihydropteroate synthase
MTIAAAVRIMGILNVTPDSFSDGGNFNTKQEAVEQARLLIEAGADIIDIGGESTRPYADPVDSENELARVIPVITGIRTFSPIPISIDTTKAEVARRALAAGATIINDVSALRNDPEMTDVVIDSGAEVIIMHMKGTPGTMQDNPYYENVIEEIISFFKERLATLDAVEVDLKQVIIDPGIGFGKKLEHNLAILKHLERLSVLNQPLLIGHSRKRFLGDITGLDAADRDLVTAVISGLCLDQNVSIFRVHDVASTKYALQVSRAIQQTVDPKFS